MRCEHCQDEKLILHCPDCRRTQVYGSSGGGYIVKCCQCRQRKPVDVPKMTIGVPWKEEESNDGE